jgi:hypothetical protein
MVVGSPSLDHWNPETNEIIEKEGAEIKISNFKLGSIPTNVSWKVFQSIDTGKDAAIQRNQVFLPYWLCMLYLTTVTKNDTNYQNQVMLMKAIDDTARGSSGTAGSLFTDANAAIIAAKLNAIFYTSTSSETANAILGNEEIIRQLIGSPATNLVDYIVKAFTSIRNRLH